MKSSFVSHALNFPLSIKHISWNYASLTISGDGWVINSDKSWGVYEFNNLIFSEESEFAEIELRKIINYFIVSVERVGLKCDDIMIKLSGNLIIFFQGMVIFTVVLNKFEWQFVYGSCFCSVSCISL